MQCERCGRNVPIRSKVCPNCGKDNPNYQPREGDTYGTYTPNPARTSSGYSNTQSNTQYNAQKNTQTNAKPAAPVKEEKSNSSFKSILILALLIIGVVFIVKKCGAEKLKGTWVSKEDGISITFSDKENGYFTIESSMSSDEIVDFTYFIEKDEVVIKTKETLYINSKSVRFEFKVSGGKLTLIDQDTGETAVFYKE